MIVEVSYSLDTLYFKLSVIGLPADKVNKVTIMLLPFQQLTKFKL